MKNIVSFLITGWILIASALSADEIPTSMMNPSAWAAVAFEEGLQFPPCSRVKLNKLLQQAGHVSLCRGWLKLPKGTYQVSYKVQLQNSGKADVMQLWLTSKTTTQCKGVKLIPESSVQVSIDAAVNSLSPTVNASRELTIKLKKPSIISLNYATNGKARLSPITSRLPLMPLPFTIRAQKVAEK